MVRSNLRILLTNNKFILFIIILLFLNGVIIYKSATDEFLSPKNNKEVMEWLKESKDPVEECKAYRNQLLSSGTQSCRFSDTIYQELKLISEVSSYAQGIHNYKTSLSKIIKNMDDKLIFYNLTKDDHKSESAIITQKVYSELKKITPRMGNYTAFQYFFQLDITDGIIFIIIFAACLFLIVEERERGLFQLIKTTKRGGVKYYISKALAINLIAAFGVVLLLGERLFLYLMMYGSDSWFVPIQSVPGYLNTPFNVSIAGYLVVFLLLKLLSFSIVSLFIIFLCNLPFSSSVIYLATGIIIAFNAGLYYGIDLNSKYVFLKHSNILSLLDVKTNTDQLTFVLIGNKEYQVYQYHIILLCLLFLFLLFLGILTYLTYKRTFRADFGKNRHGFFYGFHLAGNEAKRLLIQRGGILLLLGFILFVLYINDFSKDNDKTNQFFKSYVVTLNKLDTNQAKGWLSNRMTEFQGMEEDRNELIEKFQSGEILEQAYSMALSQIEQQLLMKPIVDRLMEQSDRIDRMKSDRGLLTSYIYEPLYEEMFGETGETDRYLNLVILLLFSACFIIPIFSHDRQYQLDILFWSTKRGALSLFRSRFIILSIAELILLAISTLIQFTSMFCKYGMVGLHSNIQSLIYFEDFPIPITITGFLIMINIIRLIGVLIITITLIALSMYSKDVIQSLLTGILIVICPAILAMLGFSPMKKYGLTPLLEPAILIADNNIWLYMGLAVILTIIAVFSIKAFAIWRKKDGA